MAPRPKDDADRIKKNRDSRRELLEGLGEYTADDDELSEVTKPDIQVHVHPAVQRDERHASPVASSSPPVQRRKSGVSLTEQALGALPDTLDSMPKNHRLFALVAVLIAAIAAYAISRGIWG
jgi:hypothetical protein